MEELSSVFGTISEFAIGLAGFTGVLFVLSPTNKLDRRIAVLRFTNLLLTSFTAGFFALLPITLTSFSLSYSEAISIATFCLAIFMSTWLLLAAIYVPRQGVVAWLALVMFGGAALVLALQIAGLFFFASIRAGLYSAGLYILLLQGAIVFAYAGLSIVGVSRSDP